MARTHIGSIILLYIEFETKIEILIFNTSYLIKIYNRNLKTLTFLFYFTSSHNMYNIYA